MSVQRIDNPKNHTHGWQARVTLDQKHRLTKFLADKSHGGEELAYWLAAAEEELLWIRVRKAQRAEARCKKL